jgi:hypothetical protein
MSSVMPTPSDADKMALGRYEDDAVSKKPYDFSTQTSSVTLAIAKAAHRVDELELVPTKKSSHLIHVSTSFNLDRGVSSY